MNLKEFSTPLGNAIAKYREIFGEDSFPLHVLRSYSSDEVMQMLTLAIKENKPSKPLEIMRKEMAETSKLGIKINY